MLIHLWKAPFLNKNQIIHAFIFFSKKIILASSWKWAFGNSVTIFSSKRLLPSCLNYNCSIILFCKYICSKVLFTNWMYRNLRFEAILRRASFAAKANLTIFDIIDTFFYKNNERGHWWKFRYRRRRSNLMVCKVWFCTSRSPRFLFCRHTLAKHEDNTNSSL